MTGLCNPGRFCGKGEISAEGSAALSTTSYLFPDYKADFKKGLEEGRCAMQNEASLKMGRYHEVVGMDGFSSVEECAYVCQSLLGRTSDDFGMPMFGIPNRCTGFNYNLVNEE